jgi:CIC family chloride channel protein
MRDPHPVIAELGDFTATPRVIAISAIAVVIGVIASYIALALFKLIGLFTNLFFYQRWNTSLVSPAGNHLGWLELIVPVIGGLIVGIMARYGSDRIRGHGIPEAIEAILMNGSRVEPKVAILKPLSAAISIGSGGPFGAEGPIIMTGGAIGSLVAQFFHLTAAERKTLLCAGAAAGMSATFAAPVASVLIAVELLLFEWKPRSMVPVALASATAAAARRYVLGMGPIFPVPAHPLAISPGAIVCCVLAGILTGALSLVVTQAVYASEDLFLKVPIHWMWWPMIGGLVIGAGGLVFPQALGVGYDTIGQLLQGNVATKVLIGVLVVKSIIWSFSLGSGTSGGVLAPLLMMGGALGGLEAMIFPNEGAGFWPLVSMGAILGGTMGSPFTGIIFALELTHDVNMMLPLLIAVTVAHTFTALLMHRSILTEKIARRGYHLSREYAVDPLEILFTREVMRSNIVALPAGSPMDTLVESLRVDPTKGPQRLYPIVDDRLHVIGVVTRVDLQKHVDAAPRDGVGQLAAMLRTEPIVAYPDEPLRVIVQRMAETGITRFPVVERGSDRKLVGMIALDDLLKARVRNMDAERRRETVLRVRFPFVLGGLGR